MSRYIDADKIGIGFANPDVFENKSYAEGWNSAVEIIMKQPTADVQEIKHGNWNLSCRDLGWVECKCSECGYTDVFDDECFYNYCPECGAKIGLE